jgi:hypothetical protein
MKHKQEITLSVLTLSMVFLFAGITSAQEREKKLYIQATAMGTSTQLGRVISINIIIDDYSTPEERAVLLQAFDEGRSEGLANALDKMRSKGRISITGTIGYDVNFIRVIDMPDGSRRIRFVTDRPILFGEVWSSTRSRDYSLSMGDFIISPTKDKSEGTIYPVAKFIIEKGELGIETYQNPWKLTNIRVRD